MIAQLQCNRMRIYINLLRQIRLFVFAHVMIEQGHRYDQRDLFLSILFDDFKQFLLFVRRQLFFKVPHDVLQHIDIFLQGGF